MNIKIKIKIHKAKLNRGFSGTRPALARKRMSHSQIDLTKVANIKTGIINTDIIQLALFKDRHLRSCLFFTHYHNLQRSSLIFPTLSNKWIPPVTRSARHVVSRPAYFQGQRAISTHNLSGYLYLKARSLCSIPGSILHQIRSTFLVYGVIRLITLPNTSA